MKKFPLVLFCITGLALTSCHDKKKNNEEVVAKRYIHKYGYDVSQEEWETSKYPGQEVTTLRNGVTITSTYEDGVLNGPTTYTFPHSQTKQCTEYYDKGHLIKKINYTIQGLPSSEELYLGETHLKVTTWFPSGTPQSIEEYLDGKLVNAEYCDQSNNAVARITKGEGERILRNQHHKVIGKELFKEGVLVQLERYHANGNPAEIVEYAAGQLHGDKKVFAENGEPLSIEEYFSGKKDGLCSYFQNGCKFLEIEYAEGRKEGVERHYIDGDILVEETHWFDGKKHGPSTIFHDGMSKTAWFYNNERVSAEKFKDLTQREKEIAIMDDRANLSFIEEDEEF